MKRSTDTRIRREVVGQLLDYAANAVVHWPVETIQAKLERRCGAEGGDPLVALQDAVGVTTDPDELLNEQMDPPEVLAVEVSQYVHAGIRAMVPRVLGQTAASELRKSRVKRQGREWDEVTFFAELESALQARCLQPDREVELGVGPGIAGNLGNRRRAADLLRPRLSARSLQSHCDA